MQQKNGRYIEKDYSNKNLNGRHSNSNRISDSSDVIGMQLNVPKIQPGNHNNLNDDFNDKTQGKKRGWQEAVSFWGKEHDNNNTHNNDRKQHLNNYNTISPSYNSNNNSDNKKDYNNMINNSNRHDNICHNDQNLVKEYIASNSSRDSAPFSNDNNTMAVSNELLVSTAIIKDRSTTSDTNKCANPFSSQSADDKIDVRMRNELASIIITEDSNSTEFLATPKETFSTTHTTNLINTNGKSSSYVHENGPFGCENNSNSKVSVDDNFTKSRKLRKLEPPSILKSGLRPSQEMNDSMTSISTPSQLENLENTVKKRVSNVTLRPPTPALSCSSHTSA